MQVFIRLVNDLKGIRSHLQKLPFDIQKCFQTGTYKKWKEEQKMFDLQKFLCYQSSSYRGLTLYSPFEKLFSLKLLAMVVFKMNC